MATIAEHIDPVPEAQPTLSGNLDRETKARWQRDNADFIAAYNQVAKEEGLPLAPWRMF